MLDALWSVPIQGQVAERLARPDVGRWLAQVQQVRRCSHPVRLAGTSHTVDTTTGEILGSYDTAAEPEGVAYVRCGNRRASVCPSCSHEYKGDVWHVLMAGAAGGMKDVPATVAAHPLVFATFTAPSFGPVHTAKKPGRPGSRRCTPRTGDRRQLCPHGRPLWCMTIHDHDDGLTGQPLCTDCYDYPTHLIWQWWAPELWRRFTIALRRQVARHLGVSETAARRVVRVQFAKVAEYQRRGLVHFHAVIRLDGPHGPHDPAPAWATAELLDQAIHAAARAVLVESHRPDGTVLPLVWGEQVDVRPIRTASAHEVEQDGVVSDGKLAAYVAKYATKGTGARDTPDRPIRSQLDIDHLRISDHHRRMIQTAWNLGDLHFYAELNLRKWAHMLGFRGHFLTKSKHYSTTFKRIREDRRAYRAAEVLDQLGLDAESVIVVNDWTYTGSGYANDAERELASGIAERLRAQRQRQYTEEDAA